MSVCHCTRQPPGGPGAELSAADSIDQKVRLVLAGKASQGHSNLRLYLRLRGKNTAPLRDKKHFKILIFKVKVII